MITASERLTGKSRATPAQGPHACAGPTHPRAPTQPPVKKSPCPGEFSMFARRAPAIAPRLWSHERGGTATDVTAAHGGRSRQSKKHSKTYRSISAILSWLTARRPTTLSTSLRARFLPYLLTLAIAWLPWLILTWPGSMRDDTLAQYLQSSGLHHYYTQHPLFDTLTFGLFWHIGSALGSPLIGQALYTVTPSGSTRRRVRASAVLHPQNRLAALAHRSRPCLSCHQLCGGRRNHHDG